jgi:glycerophosphoryl diester phosphodiesterase
MNESSAPSRLLSATLHDFRRTWPQLILTDLLSRTLAVVVLTPLVGVLLKLFLLSTDDSVLTDTDIAMFVLHPIGLVALLVVGSASLGLLFAETGVLMVIGFGAIEDRRVTYLDALLYVWRRILSLVRLAGRFILRLLLISAPFLAGVGGIYLAFLGEHDINFYLTDRPPEFRQAVVLAGVILAILAIVVLRQVAKWILALPLALFTDCHGGRALRDSAAATRGRVWTIALWLVLWLASVWLVATAATFLVGRIGGLLIPDLEANIWLIAAGLALTLLFAGLANLTVQVVSTSLFPLLVVRLYVSMAGPGRLVPSLSQPGTLGERASFRIPGKAFLAAAVAALLGISLTAYFITRSIDTEQTAAIIAHRGASGLAPENTMASFERAIADEADWIELDVQENADGTVVVAHDSDFMKVARNGLKIWDATDDDLESIDIGSWYGPEFGDQRVPTLRQVLERARGEVGVVIELKYYGHDRELESRVVDIVEDVAMESEIMLMSLDRSGLRKAAMLRPEWARGLLATVSIGDLTRLGVDFLALNAAAATRPQIRRAHKRGMKVYVWTINDPVQMSVMLSRGADGIITDEPSNARQVLALREQLSPLGHLVIWIAGETGLLRASEDASAKGDA